MFVADPIRRGIALPGLFDHRVGDVDAHDFVVVVRESDSQAPDSAAEIQRAPALPRGTRRSASFVRRRNVMPPCLQKPGLVPFGLLRRGREDCRARVSARMRFPLTSQPAKRHP